MKNIKNFFLICFLLQFQINDKLKFSIGRNMAIARFGYEPKRGFNKNDDSEESDTDSDNDSESSANRAKS